jgi:hypothetical protein
VARSHPLGTATWLVCVYVRAGQSEHECASWRGGKQMPREQPKSEGFARGNACPDRDVCGQAAWWWCETSSVACAMIPALKEQAVRESSACCRNAARRQNTRRATTQRPPSPRAPRHLGAFALSASRVSEEAHLVPLLTNSLRMCAACPRLCTGCVPRDDALLQQQPACRPLPAPTSTTQLS